MQIYKLCAKLQIANSKALAVLVVSTEISKLTL